MQRVKRAKPRVKTITGEIVKEATTPDKWSGLLSIGMNVFAFLFAVFRLWELKAVRALWAKLFKRKKRRRRKAKPKTGGWDV